jgi:putative addiction module CopG family antidote
MAVMTVELSPRLENMIEEMIATGHYADAGDVIELAVRLLEMHDRRQRLRASAAESFAAIKRGEGIELTPQLMDELSREADEHERLGLPLNPDVCG